MAARTGTKNADVLSRIADSGEHAVRSLIALPLRMLIGALDVFEAQLHKAADTLREIDPVDERLVKLERRMDSLEKQASGRRQRTRTTTAARQRPPAAVSVEAERVEPSTGRTQDAPGQTPPRATAGPETQAAGTTRPTS
jgi:hypothetical protein